MKLQIGGYVVLGGSHADHGMTLVWGVGKTPEAAWVKAIESARGKIDLVGLGFRCVPATEGLVVALAEDDKAVATLREVSICCARGEEFDLMWGRREEVADHG